MLEVKYLVISESIMWGVILIEGVSENSSLSKWPQFILLIPFSAIPPFTLTVPHTQVLVLLPGFLYAISSALSVFLWSSL